VIACAFAASEDQAAPPVIAQTRRRTRGHRGVPWVSDGRKVYKREVMRVYRDPQRTGRRGRPSLSRTDGVGLTQAVKHRRGYRLVGVEVRSVLGPVAQCPYANCEERLNGVLRDRLNCLTRKTHAFAKRVQTWDAAVWVSLFEHNWLRPHRALRQAADGLPDGRRYLQRTPAMAQGLSDHAWSWAEFLGYQLHQHWRE
jgi:hypothetical protein